MISVHGCWVYSNLPIENEEESALEESWCTSISLRTNRIRAAIKLQSCLVQEEIERRAGFWGYLMQTIYQVSQFNIATNVTSSLILWACRRMRLINEIDETVNPFTKSPVHLTRVLVCAWNTSLYGK